MSSKYFMTFSRILQLRKQTKTTMSTKLDFIPRHNNPDVFGTLNKQQSRKEAEEMPEEKGDKEEVDFIDNIDGKVRLKPIEYAKIIKQHLNSKDLVSAINVLETRMLQKENAKPDKYIYNLLISGCAQLGYTKKAFQLFNQMKKRGVNESASTYTSLFNACANDPWPKDGLEAALHLKDLMKRKGYQINEVNANAMIKAFGRCGDIQMAFTIVDEMKQNNLKITTTTINFLLQACASDVKSGLRHALIVWRKLIKLKIKPNLYTYNLLLRCTRDCQLGKPSEVKEALQEYLPNDKLSFLIVREENQFKNIESSFNNSDDSCNLVPLNETNTLTANLLAIEPQFSTLIYVDKIEKNWHKLMLFGGAQGFLEIMAHSKIKPDVKTFTQLLSLIPASRDAEQFLIEEMKKSNVKMDIDFCNMLIKKRNMENQFPAGREVLKIIASEKLVPNTITFGVLALGCRRLSEAKELLEGMKELGIPVNVEILGTLVHCGCEAWNLKMIIYLVGILLREKIKPNNIFMRHVNSLHYKINEQIKLKESGVEVNLKFNNKDFLQDYRKFVDVVNHLNTLEIEDPENMHPWKQFKNESDVTT
ncbi:pentatricopeptide repeat-containing protein 1, mitochondrial [Cimex lectularius]|uniref:Pentacotripeptide-repeat region of PRORP domain-containing protein n=1 Tax=Cimex lectularius TaxID=79782 RepID=A0A8I6RMV2_CIMLE|nr:pentatricopeptide repeat-containing protein 1, mitochondrial [Cimex lectularius]